MRPAGTIRRARFLALLVAGVLGVATGARAQEVRVDFFDVGQGDAALITSPTGRTVLVDGGPPAASHALVGRLSSLRRPIDLVLLSHRHLDHMGALPQLITDGPGVRTFIDSPFPHPSPLYDRLLEAIVARAVTVKEAVAGRVIDLGGGATLTLLGPPSPPIVGTAQDVNANSVVARLDYRGFSVLFCGDAEAETERWLLASGRPLAARVVKVAHHGSHYASTEPFVRAVRPEVAVVSVGAGNDYGHPTPEVLERWRRAGARVLRTDLDGDIAITSDGSSLVVHTSPTARAGAQAASPSQPDAATSPHAAAAPYVASRRSRVFHLANCRNAASIHPSNRVPFASRAEAVASGRRPAGDCHP